MTDPAGRVSQTIDPAGITTTYVRDEEGNVLLEGIGEPRWSENNGFPIATTYSYDDAGRMLTMTEPRGNVYACDCAADYTTTYAYDRAGNLTSTTDPLGHTTSTSYDRLSRPLTHTDERGKATTLSYDTAGRTHTVTTPTSHTTTYNYDANGNVTEREDPRGGSTMYAYDDAGQLTSTETPGGKVTNLSYDANGNQAAIVTPAGTATATAGDGTITLGHDPIGRLTATTYSDGTPSVSWAYDKAGRVTTMTDGLSAALGDQTRAYDDAGRLLEVSRGSSQFTYTYDAAGRANGYGYPDGRATTLSYDAYGRLQTQDWGTPGVTYEYDRAGNLTTASRSTMLATTWSYDRAGRTTEATTTDGTNTLATFTQELDAAGNPTTITTSRAGAGTAATTYTYDDGGQITKACYTAPCASSSDAITYIYDANGNRTQTVRTGVPDAGTTNYAYDVDDQLAVTKDAAANTIDAFTHDDNGNLTMVTGAHPATYTTNLAGQLTQAVLGATTTYTYDGLGNRAASTTGGDTTTYAWDIAQPNPLLVATDVTGTAEDLQLTYGPTGPLTVAADGTEGWDLQDLQGNITDLLEGSNASLGTYTFDPFGDALATTGTDPLVTLNPLRFASEYLDVNSGLYNNRARQYNTALGRFTSTDPVGVGAGAGYVSPYLYVTNQPTLLTDPSGMCPWCVGAFVAEHWSGIKSTSQAMLFEAATNPDAVKAEAVIGAGRSIADPIMHGSGYDPYGLNAYAYDCYDQIIDNWERSIGLNPDSAWHTAGGVALDVALLATGVGEAKLGLRGATLAAEIRAVREAELAGAAANAAARTPGVIRVGELKPPGVPKGVAGTPVRSGKGLEYQIPRGTPEIDPRVSSIRVMDPVTTGKYQYPNGYVTYTNSGGQVVNPLTGRTLQPSDPLWHIELP